MSKDEKKRTLADTFIAKPDNTKAQILAASAKEFHEEKVKAIIPAYAVSENDLKQLLKKEGDRNPTKTVKNLKSLWNIHRVHPQIVKRKQRMRFSFCPSKLGKGGRCTTRLLDSMQMLPQIPDEIVNETDWTRVPKLDTEHCVLHSFVITHNRNTSPFQLVLRSNMFDVVFESLRRHHTNENMLRSIADQKPLIMADLPIAGGCFQIEPNCDAPVTGEESICFKPFGYTEPEAARISLSATEQTTLNQICYVDVTDPKTQLVASHGVFPQDHVLAIAARANFDEYLVEIRALSKSAMDGYYFLLLPVKLIQVLNKDYVARQLNCVPICETKRGLFEVCRLMGGDNWTMPIRGFGPEVFDKTYEAELEFSVSYSLRDPDLKNAAITMPSVVIPTNAVLTERELKRTIDQQVSEKINLDNAVFDLQALRIQKDDDEEKKD